ncbi:MAG: hypothetical protein JSV05_02450 [Candidatus Bathyarchaeota archaeon]|nr:MAG: hypothetical protein JSV05_02450 [Candidatus Bathyarchaeota archaeon]
MCYAFYFKHAISHKTHLRVHVNRYKEWAYLVCWCLRLKKSILYFSGPGEVNTDETLEEAKIRADELGIKHIVVASTKGKTAIRALEVFKGSSVVVVPHVTGLREPGIQELSNEIQEKIRSSGGKIVIATHAFSGVNRAIQAKSDIMFPVGIVAQTLRLFGQGTKVAVEIVAMATDAGAIPADQDVIAIGGSGRGADTAVVIKPANSHRLFDMVIKEIIAKPHHF